MNSVLILGRFCTDSIQNLHRNFVQVVEKKCQLKDNENIILMHYLKTFQYDESIKHAYTISLPTNFHNLYKFATRFSPFSKVCDSFFTREGIWKKSPDAIMCVVYRDLFLNRMLKN